MTTTKSKLVAGAIVLLAVGGVIFWQDQRGKHLIVENTALREQAEQAEQVASLIDDRQRLTEQLEEATHRHQTSLEELARLRGQDVRRQHLEEEIARLRARNNRLVVENGRLLVDRDRLAEKVPEEDLPHDIWADRHYGQGTSARMHAARDWATALVRHANRHDGQYPSTFEEAVPFLRNELSIEERAETVLAADRYEVLFDGRFEDLRNLPQESVIVLGEKEPWRTESGEWAKTYGRPDGSSFIHTEESRDSFERYEAIRIPRPEER